MATELNQEDYTPDELAKILGCGPWIVYAGIRGKELSGYAKKPGETRSGRKELLIARGIGDKWIAAQRKRFAQTGQFGTLKKLKDGRYMPRRGRVHANPKVVPPVSIPQKPKRTPAPTPAPGPSDFHQGVLALSADPIQAESLDVLKDLRTLLTQTHAALGETLAVVRDVRGLSERLLSVWLGATS